MTNKPGRHVTPRAVNGMLPAKLSKASGAKTRCHQLDVIRKVVLEF